MLFPFLFLRGKITKEKDGFYLCLGGYFFEHGEQEEISAHRWEQYFISSVFCVTAFNKFKRDLYKRCIWFCANGNEST